MNTEAPLSPLPLLDTAQLCSELADQMRPGLRANTHLIGIHTGGVWLAECLAKKLELPAPGTLDISFYRDDFSGRGMHVSPKSTNPGHNIDDAHIILVDDILHTGRTIRAALNVLFDYGRPACVELAVLIDRDEHELPIHARYCAHRLPTVLAAGQRLKLECSEDGSLQLRLAPQKTEQAT